MKACCSMFYLECFEIDKKTEKIATLNLQKNLC